MDLLLRMISERARGVLRVIRLGHYHKGKTERCARAKAYHKARLMAGELNNAAPEAEAELLVAWGGSA